MKTAELTELDYPPPDSRTPSDGLSILRELSHARRAAYLNGDLILVGKLTRRLKVLTSGVEHT